jgi:oligopeptidase A
MNPLLDFSGLPRFADVRVEHIAPAIDALIAEVRATVERIAVDAVPATWETVVVPQLAATERLDRAWAVVTHINAVVNTPELREAYNQTLQKVTELNATLGQDSRLHARYAAVRAAPQFDALTPSQRRLVDNELRDFRLGGAELSPPAKLRFRALREALAALLAKFE